MSGWLRRLLTPLALTAALAACDVPLTEQGIELTNQCDDDDGCGTNGRCIEGVCVTTEADLGGVVIQFDVPSGAPFAADTSQLVSPKDGNLELSGSSSGYYHFFDLEIAGQVQVATSFVVNNLPAECAELAAADDTLPIALELHPTPSPFPDTSGPAGVPLPPYSTSSPEGESSHTASLRVPQGMYDVYVIPKVPASGDGPEPECKLPPALLQNQNLNAGQVAINLTVDSPTVLSGVINDFNLEGWTVDLLENKKGRIISNAVVLPPTAPTVGAPFDLLYWKSLEPEGPAAPILRLTPPPDKHDLGMPNLYWSLEGLGASPQLTLAALDGVTPIEVSGTVVNEEAGYEPVPATLAIQSEELVNGSFGENVSFKTTVESDGEGKYSVKLLPGKYNVVAMPNDDKHLAVTPNPLPLNEGDQGAGKRMSVYPKRNLVGSAHTAWGAPANEVAALLQPTSAAVTSYLASVLQVSDIQPSGAAGLTAQNGGFSLAVDPGKFNLSLRPEPSTFLPWAVLSRYTIAEASAKVPNVSLELTNPVVLIGQVRSPFGHTIGGARIRAWILPPPSSDESGNITQPSAIQIAETTSDDHGSYRLLLPASISASLSQ